MTHPVGPDDWSEELKRQYLRSLAGKLSILEALVEGLQQNPNDGELLEQLTTAVHKIHGSAGTYGLSELTLATREWERTMFTAQEESRKLTDREMDEIQGYLREFRSLVLKLLES